MTTLHISMNTNPPSCRRSRSVLRWYHFLASRGITLTSNRWNTSAPYGQDHGPLILRQAWTLEAGHVALDGMVPV